MRVMQAALVARLPRVTGPAPPGRHRLYALLREICEEVVRIRGISPMRAKLGERRLVIPVLTATTDQEAPRVDRRLAEAGQVLESDDSLADQWSDALTRVANLWDDIKSAFADSMKSNW